MIVDPRSLVDRGSICAVMRFALQKCILQGDLMYPILIFRVAIFGDCCERFF
ncbi:MAG: hypothetical protein RLZZ511_2981 [Cyanobacteriota bacterium]|jgi:hypothetical protein